MKKPIIQEGGPLPAWQEALLHKQARLVKEAAQQAADLPLVVQGSTFTDKTESGDEPEIVAGLPVPEPQAVELPWVESNEDAFDRRLATVLPHNQLVQHAPLIVERTLFGTRCGKALLVYQTVRRLDSWLLPYGVVLEGRARMDMSGRRQFLLVAGQVASIEEIDGLTWVRLKPIPARQRRDVQREVQLALGIKIPLYFWPDNDASHGLRSLWPENILRGVDLEK